MHIRPIPAFKDNYIWVIHDERNAVIVDPGIAFPVIEYLQLKRLQLSAILITHHHSDHTGGNAELLRLRNVPIYGPKNEATATINHPVSEGDEVNLQELKLSLKVLNIPGHTQGHIAYYGSKPASMVFCGDTLFSCGCGRIFEGTPQQMYESLQKLSHLPNNTSIYCAHEYTLDNICFAKVVDPKNPSLIKLESTAKKLRHQNIPTIPTTLSLEKVVNPFLRCDQQEIINSTQNYAMKLLSDPLDVFTVLREWKNLF